MPWFNTQGLLLTGYLVTRFLSSTTDLRRYMPEATGGQFEVQVLLVIAALFPASGALAVCAALLGAAREGSRVATAFMLLAAGSSSLAAFGLGVSRLPAGTSAEIGMWVVGAASSAILVGAVSELSSVQRTFTPSD
jgi:hypothetical protein